MRQTICVLKRNYRQNLKPVSYTHLDMAVEKDLISKSGAWYGYKEERIGQGRENAKQYMADHPEMMAEVSKLVRDAYGLSLIHILCAHGFN